MTMLIRKHSDFLSEVRVAENTRVWVFQGELCSLLLALSHQGDEDLSGEKELAQINMVT